MRVWWVERDGGVVVGRDGQGLATEGRLQVAMSAPCDGIYGPEDHDGDCVHAVAGRSVVVMGGKPGMKAARAAAARRRRRRAAQKRVRPSAGPPPICEDEGGRGDRRCRGVRM